MFVLACTSVLTLGLTACAGPASATAPAATSSPTPSATAAATPEPAPAAEAATVVISVDALTILDANGATLAAFDYFGADAAAAVAALTNAFGVDPVAGEAKSTNHPETNAVTSQWSGFELRDLTAETSYPDAVDFWVKATVAEVNGIDIRTGDGVLVGMALGEVEPLSYRSWVDTGTGAEIPMFLLDQLPVQTTTSPDYAPAALSVVVSGEAPGGTVALITAPGANFGS